ncbi:hypothetical protein AB0C29_44025 [Actinoplanes sp. NPDC048791]
MEGVALVLSVLVTRHTSRSALPGAEVQVPRERWRWARAVSRRVTRGRA